MGFFFLIELHDLGSFETSLNAMFIVFVPKKRGCRRLEDFRPISLVGGLYKLLGHQRRGLLKASQLGEKMVWGWRSPICYWWMIPSFFGMLVRRI